MSSLATPAPRPISRTMSNLSFQLPDLVALTSSFPFRINKNCKLATDQSEAWLLGDESSEFKGPILLKEERAILKSVKYGLLASLCSPAADPPQLKILADFWSVVILSHARILRGMEHGWAPESNIENAGDGLELLGSNELFKSLVPPLTRALSSRPLETRLQWRRQFTGSVQAFATAQVQLYSSLKAVVEPAIPEYLALRRETYASSIYLDLLDLLEIAARPYGCSTKDAEKLEQLTTWSICVTGWALDIFSFASGPGVAFISAVPTHAPTHNLISLLMTHRHLSVQGAMNFAGGMVKDALEEIQRLERELIPALPGSGGSGDEQGWSEWLGSSLGAVKSVVGIGDTQLTLTKSKFLADVPVDGESRLFTGVPVSGQTPEQRAADMVRYIQVMKDWIVGTVHWGYETELYFGQKGDEVRSFGWVFLNGGDRAT